MAEVAGQDRVRRPRYLERWPSDLDSPTRAARDEPVTNVSWFAAEAFCKARGLRLPTTDQWEYALADDGRGQEAVRARSLEWFAKPNARTAARAGTAGQRLRRLRLVGFVWEWTLDFAAYATTGIAQHLSKDDAQFLRRRAAGVATPPTIRPSCAMRCGQA